MINQHLNGLAELFNGSESLFAKVWVDPNDPVNAKGKREAKYQEVPRAPADDDWNGHGDGQFGLTISPEKDDGTCSFLVIDIDVYGGLDFAGLIKAVHGKLAVGNSKSEGAHLYGFLKEPVPRAKLEAVGKRIMFALGYSDDENAPEGIKAEVFPRTPKPGKKPRGVNIPYSGYTNGKCHEVILTLMVSSTGGAQYLRALSLPEVIAKYGGENKIAFEDLEALAINLESTKPDRGQQKTGALTPEETAERWVQYWAKRIREAPGGHADKVLNKAAHSMGYSAPHIATDRVERILHAAWVERKEQHEDASKYEAAWAKVWPHAFLEAKAKGIPQFTWLEERLDVVDIADVKSRTIDWLWPGKLARGKITMLSAFPKMGKSIIAADIAARLSSGAEIPCGGGARFPKGNVLYLCHEDDHNDTLVPRLRVMGADPRGVKIVKSVVGKGARRVDLSRDAELLRRELIEGDYALLIIDPISAYQGKEGTESKSNTNPAVRGFLAPIEDLAQEFHIAVLLVNHQRKDHEGPAIYSVLNSVGWVAAPRVVLVGGKHFEMQVDEEGKKKKVPTGVRLIAIAGANNAPDGADLTMAYEIVNRRVTLDDGKESDVGIVEWRGTMDIPADDVTAGKAGVAGQEGKKQGKRDDAKAFIRRTLRQGMQRSKDIITTAEPHGFSPTTMHRAATEMKKDGELFMEKQPVIENGPIWWSLKPIQWDLFDGKEPEPFGGL